MAKADIYNLSAHADKGPRNAFDLSHSFLFTSPCGQLLPAYVEDVKRDDKIKLSVSFVTRTRPVNTSAFMAFDQKIDFWFVPYRLIWSGYDNWRLSQSINRSTLQIPDIGLQNYLPYTTWSSLEDFVTSSRTLSSSYLSNVGDVATMVRYLDLLGYGLPPIDNITELLRTDTAPSATVKSALVEYFHSLDINGLFLNYFRLAAFQCVYMASYRNEDYEVLDPSYYNADNLFINNNLMSTDNSAGDVNISNPCYLFAGNQLAGDNGPRLSLERLFTPRFKNWRKDLFTSLKPNSGFGSNGPIFGQTSGTDFDWSVPKTSPSEVWPNSAVSDKFSSVGPRNPYLAFQQLTNDRLYAQNIRLLMSQDKFIRASLYADKNYKSQMDAIFGVEVKEPDVPRYLGSCRNNVSISDVVATSAGNSMTETEGDGTPNASSVLGEIAGKGYGSSDEFGFESSFNEDGIVIGIHYIMPRNNYDSYRLNRFNTKVSRWDYYYPMFDGLGLQPTFVFERNIADVLYKQGTPGFNLGYSSILGYSARYAEYKCRQSETHGTFAANQPDWNWTLSNNQLGIVSATDMANYKISPSLTDRIFTLAYNGSQATDPFMCYLDYNVIKISNMEQLGVPSI